MSNVQDEYSEFINAVNFFIHPDYETDDDVNLDWDFAILVLENPVTNPNIGTIGLAGVTTTVTTDDVLISLGWGDSEDRGEGNFGLDYPHELQFFELNLLTDDQCDDIFGDEYDGDIQMCADSPLASGESFKSTNLPFQYLEHVKFLPIESLNFSSLMHCYFRVSFQQFALVIPAVLCF